jgi:hypothetical protein
VEHAPLGVAGQRLGNDVDRGGSFSGHGRAGAADGERGIWIGPSYLENCDKAPTISRKAPNSLLWRYSRGSSSWENGKYRRASVASPPTRPSVGPRMVAAATGGISIGVRGQQHKPPPNHDTASGSADGNGRSRASRSCGRGN